MSHLNKDTMDSPPLSPPASSIPPSSPSFHTADSLQLPQELSSGGPVESPLPSPGRKSRFLSSLSPNDQRPSRPTLPHKKSFSLDSPTVPPHLNLKSPRRRSIDKSRPVSVATPGRLDFPHHFDFPPEFIVRNLDTHPRNNSYQLFSCYYPNDKGPGDQVEPPVPLIPEEIARRYSETLAQSNPDEPNRLSFVPSSPQSEEISEQLGGLEEHQEVESGSEPDEFETDLYYDLDEEDDDRHTDEPPLTAIPAHLQSTMPAPLSRQATENDKPTEPVNRPTLPQRSTSLRAKASPRAAKTAESPPSKVSTFFGWGKAKPKELESPATVFSEDTLSPEPSPNMSSAENGQDGYGFDDDDYYAPRSPLPLDGRMGRVDELLRELHEVSTELAASIRREMELEDEVDRVRTEMPSGPDERGRRTSDYYSDGGRSSTQAPGPDLELKLQAMEQTKRRAEQERASLRTEMAQKVQEHVRLRSELEGRVQSLQEELKTKEFKSSETTDKERELESNVEDMKRRMNEERQHKSNFEDLLVGMREELESQRTERDNLRDEVVPQLRARLEGLESDAANYQKLVYENTQMQHELQSLRNENNTLVNARRLQLEMQNHGHGSRIKSIAEEDDGGSPRNSLSRSNSLARNKSMRQRSGSLYGPGSPKEPANPESLPERVKDLEEQRDALHRTLKHLIMRQDQMTRQFEKKVKALEVERDRATTATPRRAAFALEVQSLRGEVNLLRQRADDALESKWQCEKGLSGLKMDLDRAQQETTSLRDLLQTHDIIVPLERPRSGSSNGDNVPNQESLDQTWNSLQDAHKQSMERFNGAASKPAEVQQAEDRMRSITEQVDRQRAANVELRERLTEAVGRGEREQQASTEKINALQSALKAAEDRVMQAQSISEDAVSNQEEHIKSVKEVKTEQGLRGVTSPVPSINVAGPGLSKGIRVSEVESQSSPFGLRSPKLGKTTSGTAQSALDASRAGVLQLRVADLERTATEADKEMQVVIERMNRAQIEVGELQAERDEAMRETRKLQRQIVETREHFKNISG